MLTDSSPMPYGKYEGKPMGDIPAAYLLWLFENSRCNAAVKAYIEDNIEVIRTEIARDGGNRRPRCCPDCEHFFEGIYGFGKVFFCDLHNKQVKWKSRPCDDLKLL